MGEITTDFDLDCRACPRLAPFLDEVGTDYPDYHHARPVPQFGVKHPKLLIVGLGTEYHLDSDLCLVSSYHCSRYNTSTKRLTTTRFKNVFKQINCQGVNSIYANFTY